MEHDCPWGWRACSAEELCYLCLSAKMKALQLQIRQMESKTEEIFQESIASQHEGQRLKTALKESNRLNGELRAALAEKRTCKEGVWRSCGSPMPCEEHTYPEKRKSVRERAEELGIDTSKINQQNPHPPGPCPEEGGLQR